MVRLARLVAVVLAERLDVWRRHAALIPPRGSKPADGFKGHSMPQVGGADGRRCETDTGTVQVRSVVVVVRLVVGHGYVLAPRGRCLAHHVDLKPGDCRRRGRARSLSVTPAILCKSLTELYGPLDAIRPAACGYMPRSCL